MFVEKPVDGWLAESFCQQFAEVRIFESLLCINVENDVDGAGRKNSHGRSKGLGDRRPNTRCDEDEPVLCPGNNFFEHVVIYAGECAIMHRCPFFGFETLSAIRALVCI